MTSIQSPWEWGIFRLVVGYAGLDRNFFDPFFQYGEEEKS